MKLLTAPIAIALALVFGASCDSCSKKPSEAECRAAIENVRNILGLQESTAAVEIDKAIRSCRGSSSKETARCLTRAKTEADLAACEGEAGEEYLQQEREAERKRREKVEETAQEEKKESQDGQ